MSIYISHYRRTTLTSARPLGSHSHVLIHIHVQLNISSFPLHYTGESSGIHHHLIAMHPTHGNSHVHLMLSYKHVQLNRYSFSLRSSQLFVRRRSSLRSSSISYRNHTPILGALSQVCVMEDVSHSCNHQH